MTVMMPRAIAFPTLTPVVLVAVICRVIWQNKPKLKADYPQSCMPNGYADNQDERGAAWMGQFGTTSAPRWPHRVHTMSSPSDLMGVSSGRWPTFMIVL